MKFEEIPFPREKDILVMELIMERILSATAIQSLNRCRCYLSALFLSDITTADGKYLEQLAMIPCENGTKSRYKFPREAPTQADWKRWQRFWTEYTSIGNRLPVELGRWINPTHRTWRWFYIKETDDLQRLDKNKLYHYQRRAGRTRGTTSYDVTSTEEFKGQFLGIPTSVTTAFSEATVTKHNEGPLLVKGPKQPADFWQFLASWGGEWMWEGIDDNQITKHDLTWLVDGMKNKTVTWVTDGSYDKLRAADLSGIGWVLLCTRTGKRLTGWCWERSITANSYRAEMLGLCSLHLLARALSEYYKITNWEITICCDNEGALDCSSYQLRRIKPSAKCADIRRSFRSTKLGLSGKFRYEHVYGHMDDYLLWHQLSTVQQMNCVCDSLAKGAITTAIRTGYLDRPTQLLPREDVALIINGNKVTNDISQPLRFHESKKSARKFFTNRKIKRWTEECFDEIDWENLDLALKNKPEGYKVWRSKQNSGFCGTRVQVGRYAGDHLPDEKCPNCGQREIAEHLMLCPNRDRTRLLKEQTENLEEWLYKDEKTEPELAYWIPKYI
jgi:hypothetical protein